MHCRVKPLLLMACLLISHVSYAADGIDTTLNDDKIIFSRALELTRENKLAQAESLYRDLIERNNSWPEPKNNLAVMLLNANRLDDAIVLLEDAVTSSINYRIAQENRSQLYQYLAQQAYDKALGVDVSTRVPTLKNIEKIDSFIEVVIIEKKVEVIVEVPMAKPMVIIKSIEDKPNHIENCGSSDDINETQKTTAQHLEQQLLAWSRAWSQGDYEAYLNLYSLEFMPSDVNKNMLQWKESRIAKLRFTKNIQVSVDHVRVFLELDDQFALVEFDQFYQSATYSDKVLKQMYFKREENNWLILSERTIRTY